MKTRLVHLSDIHFRSDWPENQELVLEGFFNDLSVQLSKDVVDETYLVISGDLVNAGSSKDQYRKFNDRFSDELEKLGVGKERRILVPGNHDLSLDWISSKKFIHDGVIGNQTTESEFNDFVSTEDCLLKEKFCEYLKFENEFSSFGVKERFYGKGWRLNDYVGVYCINSSVLASGSSLKDEGNLVVETRELHRWIQQTDTKVNFLVMHHPLSWLKESWRDNLSATLKTKFSFVLSGHTHQQDAEYSQNTFGSNSVISAPPLFTQISDKLGYSFVDLDEYGSIKIIYREWTSGRKFVTGVNFSNSDDGMIDIGTNKEVVNGLKDGPYFQSIIHDLERDLCPFPNQPSLWVEPILRDFAEATSQNNEKVYECSELIENPVNTVVFSPREFGQSVLSLHLCKLACQKNKFWIRLDLSSLKPHEIEREISRSLSLATKNHEDIECVVVDSLSSDALSVKSFKKLLKLVGDKPLIVMKSNIGNFFSSDNQLDKVEFQFRSLYLHSLTRAKIRELVSQYNNHEDVADDDSLLNKVVSDLDSFNLHRTPLNVITLLEVVKVRFEDNPVNRTEVIHRLLHLLFNSDYIPTYATKPDLKDCEFALGWFCQKLLDANDLSFTRTEFISKLTMYCQKNIVNIDIEVLFDILYKNQIFSENQGVLSFRFTYWIMFFAAQRMHQNEEFRDHVLSEHRYADYPELIEFYTGIGRNKDDALSILTGDLEKLVESLESKLGFPDGVDPYSLATWTITDESISRIRQELNSEVKNSNLPSEIKDDFADRLYDPEKAYSQGINNVVKDYSLDLLWQVLSASSRALRNSDYSSPELKRRLVDLIMKSWELITKIVIVLSPYLAQEGSASYEGTNFVYTGTKEDDPEKVFYELFRSIPTNIIDWFTDDLYSPKMGTLFFEAGTRSKSAIVNLYMHLIYIKKRPKGWNEKVENYIGHIGKNSYYLMSINDALATEQRYGYLSDRSDREILRLRKMALAKHQFGTKKPGKKLLDKVNLVKTESKE